MLQHWKKIDSKILLEHPRISVVEDTVLLPDNKQISYAKIINQPDSVTIICISDEKVLLQKEYSYPVDEILYQFPGGKIDNNEAPIAAGLRELQEESSYTSDSVEYLGFYYSNNRRSASKMHVIVAKDATVARSLVKDEEEFIESLWIEIDELNQMIRSGSIVNYSILAGWALYRAADEDIQAK